ncbi:MAG: pyridoxamine 5'-phosphate oxidase [Bdellovibrionales bacterium]
MIDNTDIIPPDDPWALFREWYAAARESEPNDPEAMALATVGYDGMPSVRTVLLKSYDAGGLTFFTNRQSDKGEHLKRHPKAAICFHWKSLRRQVRAEGQVVPSGDAESDAYFATRPRGSQIGAWASDQSRPLESREKLQEKLRALEARYEGKPVPRPSHWGGYRLSPLRMEFWQDREFRLHDRILYHRPGEKAPWVQERLYP